MLRTEELLHVYWQRYLQKCHQQLLGWDLRRGRLPGRWLDWVLCQKSSPAASYSANAVSKAHSIQDVADAVPFCNIRPWRSSRLLDFQGRCILYVLEEDT